MARTKRLLIRIGALLALAIAQPLAAMEPLSGEALVSACSEHQQGLDAAAASTCRGFIQGYLSATDEIVAAEERPSGFVARAIRTRASRLSDAAEKRLNSRFCLPEGERLNDLIAKVAAQPRELPAGADAADVMRRVFETHYLCDSVPRS
ncbi:Rap1a/Tai family immunity protein [Microbulbifer taiwanensis]|uniref:Rap1a/Tai family immunity protein n=1 Tax=Microbulbifer taiwanensis TaxID=986746 RepID=A0ABW1YUF4_9GAMM|nr:Rap1a/Tai family immunity protein [Microbulbifer taiwanensis]